MTHLVHEKSQLGGSLATLPHAGIRPTQVDVMESYEEILLPITSNNYTAGQVVTFQVQPQQDYISLKSSYVRIRGNWLDYAGAAVTVTDQSAPVVNFPAALFSSVQLFMNESQVSPNRTGDPWISFVDRLLLKREGANENASHTGPLYTFNAGGPALILTQSDVDEGLTLDQLDTAGYAALPPNNTIDSVGNPYNNGANMRAGKVFDDVTTAATGLGLSEYIYQPCVGAWQVDKYIPDRISLRLNLQIAQRGFYTHTATVAGAVTGWQFQPVTMELILARRKLAAQVIEQNTFAMVERPWAAATYQQVYSQQVVTQPAIDLVGMYNGPRPAYVFIGVQDARCISGADANAVYGTLNPFYMSEGSNADYTAAVPAGSLGLKATYVSNLFILVNGRQYPIRRPWDAVNQTTRGREYKAIKNLNIDGFPEAAGALISYAQFASNYTWFPFILSPTFEDNSSEEDAPTEDVAIEVHGTISGTVPNPFVNQVVHCIAYVPMYLEIDGARTVKTKTKSGVPLVFN